MTENNPIETPHSGHRLDITLAPTTRLLFLDTNALIKVFVNEPGHDVLVWLETDEAVLGYSVHLMTSVHVRDEFIQLLTKLQTKEIARAHIPETQAHGILKRATAYFEHAIGLDIVDTGPLPGFGDGADTSVSALMAKHALKHWVNHDCMILASIVNYLRCYGLGSLPHVVTADKDFAKVIKAEGFGVINPEKMSVEQVKSYLASLS